MLEFFKIHQEEELVVAGFTAPEGTRQYLGALILGAYDAQNRLRYVGKVGTGFAQRPRVPVANSEAADAERFSSSGTSARAWAHIRKAQAGCADRVPRMDG